MTNTTHNIMSDLQLKQTLCMTNTTHNIMSDLQLKQTTDCDKH